MADTTTTNFALVKPEVGASADSWGGKINAGLDGIDALFGILTKRATVGGTANAVTLTTGAALSGLLTGLTLRWRATNANTGATTINTDGLGAVAARTPTGVALPDGFIRTDVDTVATYDGTNWIVSRATENGSGVNGTWTRLEDGTLTQRNTMSTSDAFEVTWTFEVPFAATTTLSITGSAIGAVDAVRAWRYTGKGTTSIQHSVFNSNNVRTANSVDMVAVGRWY
jgi:hypothetical protein